MGGEQEQEEGVGGRKTCMDTLDSLTLELQSPENSSSNGITMPCTWSQAAAANCSGSESFKVHRRH